MINNCDFCNKIYSSLDEYKQDNESNWEEYEAIIMVGETPMLYIPCNDWFYSRCVIELNFCPKCGRKLKSDHVMLRY